MDNIITAHLSPKGYGGCSSQDKQGKLKYLLDIFALPGNTHQRTNQIKNPI